MIIVTFWVPKLSDWKLVKVKEGSYQDAVLALRAKIGAPYAYPLCTRCIALYGNREARWADFLVHGKLLNWPACGIHAAYHDKVSVLETGADAWHRQGDHIIVCVWPREDCPVQCPQDYCVHTGQHTGREPCPHFIEQETFGEGIVIRCQLAGR
jgi:hypothetical protein